MTPKSSGVAKAESGHSARVILIGGIAIERFGVDSSFEIFRCEDVSQALRFWEDAETCVLLTDLASLSENERAHLGRQMAQFNRVLVLAVVDSIDDKGCENLLRMGCVGSLRGQESAATLERALKAVIAGELWFPRAMLSRVLRGFLVAQDPNRLTTRELEILGLVNNDLNNQQIADKLFISRETVRWHIKGLHAKLGIRTRRGLQDHVRLLHRVGNAIPAHHELGNNLQRRAAS
jgi:DNA-binding NarL/FixJ family response regulator